jgi:hypothetical protein
MKTQYGVTSPLASASRCVWPPEIAWITRFAPRAVGVRSGKCYVRTMAPGAGGSMYQVSQGGGGEATGSGQGGPVGGASSVMRKVTGGTRSANGSRSLAHWMTITQTLHKNGLSVREYVIGAYQCPVFATAA